MSMTNMIHERILDQENIRCTSYRARLTKETGDQGELADEDDSKEETRLPGVESSGRVVSPADGVTEELESRREVERLDEYV
jgi:hypothetical protein